MKLSWSEEEDKILCRYCVQNFVITNSNSSINSFIELCTEKEEFSGRSSGSIRMRIQNIKAILQDKGIQNTIPLTPLSNYASLTETVLLETLVEFDVI